MKDIHSQFVYYGRQARLWLHKCEMLLPEIEKLGIWRDKGFGSIYEYAAKLAGMSHGKVNDCLRIMKHILDKPELIKVAEAKGLGAVRPVAVIATKEDAGLWAEKASVMSRHEIETYVKDYRAQVCHGTDPVTSVTVTPKPELARKFEQFKKRADFEELLEKFMDEVEAEPKPEPIETNSRHIPEGIKGDCVRNQLDNIAQGMLCVLALLCKAHHQLAHHGLIENETKSPAEWKLRTKPDTADPKYKIDQLVMNYRGS